MQGRGFPAFPTPGEQKEPLFCLRPVETEQTTASILLSLQVPDDLVAFQLQGVPSPPAPPFAFQSWTTSLP